MEIVVVLFVVVVKIGMRVRAEKRRRGHAEVPSLNAEALILHRVDEEEEKVNKDVDMTIG